MPVKENYPELINQLDQEIGEKNSSTEQIKNFNQSLRNLLGARNIISHLRQTHPQDAWIPVVGDERNNLAVNIDNHRKIVKLTRISGTETHVKYFQEADQASMEVPERRKQFLELVANQRKTDETHVDMPQVFGECDSEGKWIHMVEEPSTPTTTLEEMMNVAPTAFGSFTDKALYESVKSMLPVLNQEQAS